MEGFKKGFYITSSKNESKIEANLGQFSFTQPQLFSQQYQQSGIQQNYEEQKQTQKNTHLLTLMTEKEVQKTGEICFAPGDIRVQPFQPDEHGTASQSFTKPRGRDQKAKEGQ